MGVGYCWQFANDSLGGKATVTDGDG